MFIRFGALPEGGRSRNDETGELEAGVSVYRAEFADGIPSLELRGMDEWAAVNIALRDRPIYVVTGDEVGIGGDGEPLLANAVAQVLEGVEDIGFMLV